MRYYILMPGDRESELSDVNILGEASFDVFWASRGLKLLMKLVEVSPELLPIVTIITDTGSKLSVEQFLTKIQGLKVRS